MRGAGLVTIEDGAMLITNALGGDAGSGTPGETTVSSPFGGRYPAYGGQSVNAGAGYNMSMVTVNGGNFGSTATVTLAAFNAASTITTTFPAGEGTPANNGNGFNTAMGVAGVAPTTPGVYDINVELNSGETGFYQLEVGGGGGTATHETPVTLNAIGTATIFQNSFIFGARAGNSQAFTLGPSTDNTSADCFIAMDLPTDLNTVAVSLTPSTAPISFGYAGFSGTIRWFCFRGIPSELGTAAHTLTVNGVAADSGPPLISTPLGASSITGSTAASSATTLTIEFSVLSIGGGEITEISWNQGATMNVLTEPAGGWTVGTHTVTGVPARVSGNAGQVLGTLSATNSEGTFTTIQTTIR